MAAYHQNVDRKRAGLVAAIAASTALGLASAAAAHAAPELPPAPMYHWCPGDAWDPAWGFNWEWGLCHDDHHRDIDGDYHGYDWLGPPPPGVNPTPWYPPQPGAPPFWWRP